MARYSHKRIIEVCKSIVCKNQILGESSPYLLKALFIQKRIYFISLHLHSFNRTLPLVQEYLPRLTEEQLEKSLRQYQYQEIGEITE